MCFIDNSKIFTNLSNMKNKGIVIVSIIILSGIIFRIIPHWPNFTPIAAMALFGGAYISDKKLAILIPLVAMFISDLIIGFHGTMWAVYLSFGLIVLLGRNLQENKSIGKIFGLSLSSSALFFIITNFAVWLGSTFYTQDFSGLISCYVAAIPFFNYSLAGDLFYNILFFGVAYGVSYKYPALQLIKK